MDSGQPHTELYKQKHRASFLLMPGPSYTLANVSPSSLRHLKGLVGTRSGD